MSRLVPPVGECVVVAQPYSKADVRIIPPASFEFLSALQSGETHGDAAEQALDRDPHFDIGRELNELFMLGKTAGFHS